MPDGFQDVPFLRFTIKGTPIAKGRPRFTRSGRSYTPEKTANYETLVKFEGMQAMGDREPITAQIALEVIAYMPIPKSARKRDLPLMRSGAIRPAKRPDLDNIIKAITDGLNGICYGDDSQIVSLTADKFYGDTPGVVVTIQDLQAGEGSD